MTNMNKLQAPFERLKNYDISPDVALRKAIIMQALFDIRSKAIDKKAQKARLEAKAWIFENSSYFRQICFEAGLHPENIIMLAREELIASVKNQTKRSSNNVYIKKLNPYTEKKSNKKVQYELF